MVWFFRVWCKRVITTKDTKITKFKSTIIRTLRVLRGRGVAALLLALTFLSSCLSAELEKQAEQIKQQDEQIARQRKEIEAEKAQEQKQRDCSRAFRDYFDKAQTAGDGGRAITLYRDGLALCPDDEIAHYELGKLLMERGRNAEAEQEFAAALKINPGFIDAQKQLEAARQGN